MVYARRAGLTDDEIAAVAAFDPPTSEKQGPEPRRPDSQRRERRHSGQAWTPIEVVLLQAVDQLVASHDIDASIWAQLALAYDDAQLVEIPFVVGQYAMLSMVANALRV